MPHPEERGCIKIDRQYAAKKRPFGEPSGVESRARRPLRRVWNLIESESSKLRVNFYTQATRFSLSLAAGPRFAP
jgi:hypothetical protein